MKDHRLVCSIILLMFIGHSASARDVKLSWKHSNPSKVSLFKVYIRSEFESYDAGITMGSIEVVEKGVFLSSIKVPDHNGEEKLYIKIIAVGDGGKESPASNEIILHPTPN